MASAGIINVDTFELEADDYAARKCGAKVMENALRHTIDLIIKKQALSLVEEKAGKVNGKAHKAIVFISKWMTLLSPQMRARIKALKALQKAGY